MKKIITSITAALLLAACSNHTDTEPPYDVKQLRSDVINTLEKNTTQAFSESINDLHSTIVQLSSSVTKKNLDLVKTAWKTAAKNYSSIEVFNFGEIKSTNIQTAFYSWGANETAIEDYISSSNSITEEAINNLPTNSRGLSAIEYLVFESTEEATLQSFTNPRRVDYLVSLAKNLVSKAATYTSLWENYRNSFIENEATGVNGSINQVVNQLYALLEDVKSFKIGQPAAIEKIVTADASLLQAEKSSYSLVLIQKNIKSIEHLYFGLDNGLDDYIFSITKNNELNQEIRKEIKAIKERISDFKIVPLKEAIYNQNEQVKDLYSHIRNLLILIKVDVSNSLSVTITVTDNDGD
ncbi:imelysin family protein [Tenacibaculum sp. TC6]|uniref:imelysin family protein n=1 Tax=Tenacibaculum sp. TC6 TaxID=3423223 RepID=UPI003D36753D